MPNLKIAKQRFHELMGREYKFQELDDLGFEFGTEVQEDTEVNKQDNSKTEFYKFDCMNNRPDLLTEATLVRAFKIYLGQIEIPQIKVLEPKTKILVDESVNQIRPFVVGAVLRNIKFNEKTFKAFINAQEKLHATFCRARKYASIGTHDYDKIEGPFHYVAKDPKTFTFIPLNQEKQVDGLGMMESLENHKLKEYLHLIKDSPVYPLITDHQNRICSVPPIINSDHSKISIETKNVFIEVTALSRPKAMVCLNALVWSFSEYCENQFEVEPVQVVMKDKVFLTPNCEKKQFTVSHRKAQISIGNTLTADQIKGYLKKTGLQLGECNDGVYKVLVPFWRGDVLHQCDILEDIAICYGYKNIKPVFPSCATIGARLRINKFTDYLRHEMAQAQFNQALNFALCSRADLTTNVFNKDQSKLITIENAKTKEFQTGRTTLLPGLLRTIVENKANPLPYKLFEAGDCILLDEGTDTGSINSKRLAAVMTDEVIAGTRKEIFSVVHGSLDFILKKCALHFKKDYELVVGTSEFFFPKQQFEVILKGKKVGCLGVVHPKVLANFGWGHPTAMWELDLEALEEAYTLSFE